MHIHRFYISSETVLTHDFWVNNPGLINQWLKVLRMSINSELVLFDGRGHDRLYKIKSIDRESVRLQLVTDIVQNLPISDTYVFWALLKREKNEVVLQKCTELGVNHFVPLIADHCERSSLSMYKEERWNKIIIESAEQCGRSNIPVLNKPVSVSVAIERYSSKVNLLIAQQGSESYQIKRQTTAKNKYGIFVGPEGGWSELEKELFHNLKLEHITLSKFTLRAETAPIIAAGLLNT